VDIYLHPAAHYEKAAEICERVEAGDDDHTAYLGAIAHALLGLLRHEMTRDRN
jgi:hypothetical protein